MFGLPRLFALVAALCLAFPAAGDARPIDWPPTPLPTPTATPEVTVLPPPCAP